DNYNKFANKAALSLLLRGILTIIMIISISFITVYAGAQIMHLPPIRQVILNDNGSVIVFKTSRSTTVGDFLKNNNIILRPEDQVFPARHGKLTPHKKNEIYIKRAIPVKIFADGKELLVYT